MPQVGDGRLDHVLPTVRSHLFPNCRDIAKLESRCTSSLRRRQAGLLQLRHGLIEEVLDLVRDLAIGGRPIQEGTKTTHELTPRGHGYASAFRIRAIAAARRVQSAVSFSSCRLPLRVSV